MNYQTRTLHDKNFVVFDVESGWDKIQQTQKRESSKQEKIASLAGLRLLTDDLIWAREQCKKPTGL